MHKSGKASYPPKGGHPGKGVDKGAANPPKPKKTGKKKT